MKKACRQFSEGIAIIATGGEDAAAQTHLGSCADCAATLAEMRRIVERGQTAYFEPPRELVDAAKALMPQARRTLTARLVSSTLSLAGARSSVDDRFQMVFEAEGVQTRLMYVQEGRTWQVAGRVSDAAWSVARSTGDLRELDGGRFEFTARELADTGLVLSRGAVQVAIPSAEEARVAGPG